jgi:shikimate dehydrogenase
VTPETRLVISLAARPGRFGFTVHNAGYAALGLNFHYQPMTCTNLRDALAGVRAMDMRGCSLTMPYKTEALALMDEISPRATATGAVNTVVNEDGKLIGHNTDVLGAAELLRPHRNLPWLVLGAGGMARAFLQAARELQHGQVILSARDEAAGRALAANFGATFLAWDQREKMVGCAVLNATPIGMAPDAAQSPITAGAAAQMALVFDAVPNPHETMLVQAARSAGVPVITGRDLAMEQAFGQFELYTGQAAPRDAMRAAAGALS